MTRPWLVATTGLPYSGKTSFAAALVAASGMRVIELDALSLERRLDVANGASRGDWELTFSEAAEMTRSSLGRGQSVVIDWVNAGPADRRRWSELADACGVPFRLVSFDIGLEELDRRRTSATGAAKRVTLTEALVRRVRAQYRPPTADEAAVPAGTVGDIDTWIEKYLSTPQSPLPPPSSDR